MQGYTRQQELVAEIANYLTDWTDDITSVLDYDQSICCIESYVVRFDEHCDDLVINAIRHLDDIINPWNKSAISEILEDIGFTEEEVRRYNRITDSIIKLQFG